MISDKFVLAIDFDGTIVRQAYPSIGPIYDHAKSIINRLYDSGRYYIVIWSCRGGLDQVKAVKFLNDQGIKYHYFNENIPEFVNRHPGDEPRKLYYDLLIDDHSIFGAATNFEIEWPLLYNLVELEYIEWFKKLMR